MLEPTRRFSSRVENYIKYRPGYPQELMRILQEECGLTPDWHVADIGSGTGISTSLFLNNGNPTFGVEPNQAMRETAEKLLKNYSNFTSVNGTAEDTTLPDSSFDLVAAGQAFHWFDRDRTRREFCRILKPEGWAVLFWNERRLSGSPFLDAYEDLLRKFSPEYAQVNHRNIDQAALTAFFSSTGYKTRHLENFQSFDFDGLKGRLLSSSYAPEPGQPEHEPMIAELARIFEHYQKDGRIIFEYDTSIYLGQLAP